MCGRFTLTTPAPAIADLLGAEPPSNLAPSDNIAPMQSILAVRTAEAGGKVESCMSRHINAVNARATVSLASRTSDSTATLNPSREPRPKMLRISDYAAQLPFLALTGQVQSKWSTGTHAIASGIDRPIRHHRPVS